MTRLQIVLLTGLLLLVGSISYAAGGLYLLKPVSSDEDAVACYKAGGKAALVAEITEDGSIGSAWEPHCLVPSK